MESGHRDRILAEFGAESYDALERGLSPTDLQSLLLEVSKARAAAVTPSRVLARRRDDRFVQPSSVDPRLAVLFDSVAFDSVSTAFTPVELAPVCPLGTVSAVTLLSQDNVVSTMRNSEVVADATNCLALECAIRRSEADTVKLCASHRVLRTKRFEGPASFAHFRLFSLCTAGRDIGGCKFESEAMLEQLSAALDLLHKLREHGFTFGAARVSLTDFTGQKGDIMRHVAETLQARFPEDAIGLDNERTQAKGYYDPFSFWLFLTDQEGREHNIGDGGFTDWTQQFLSNGKERLLISGLGAERICYLFAPATA
jgi:hypothetical protein